MRRSVWGFEVFNVVSVRSEEGVVFANVGFFMDFMVFNVYYLSCEKGFVRLALVTCLLFLAHGGVWFWGRWRRLGGRGGGSGGRGGGRFGWFCRRLVASRASPRKAR